MMVKPAITSLVSANGPSVMVGTPPEKRMRAPLALGCDLRRPGSAGVDHGLVVVAHGRQQGLAGHDARFGVGVGATDDHETHAVDLLCRCDRHGPVLHGKDDDRGAAPTLGMAVIFLVEDRPHARERLGAGSRISARVDSAVEPMLSRACVRGFSPLRSLTPRLRPAGRGAAPVPASRARA